MVSCQARVFSRNLVLLALLSLISVGICVTPLGWTTSWLEPVGTSSTTLDYPRLAASGDLLAISNVEAPVDGLNAAGIVTVYVAGPSGMTHSTGTVIKQATPAAQARFGSGLALEGTTLAIGVPGAGGNVGAVEVFSLDGDAGLWLLDARITSPSSDSGQFGRVVALSGDRMVVTAPTDGVGTAFVYHRSTKGIWAMKQKLETVHSAESDRYGRAAAINGDTIVIGADGDMDYKGAMYTYTYDTTKYAWGGPSVTRPAGSTGDRIGYSLSVSSSWMAAGAPFAGSSEEGLVRLYRKEAGSWKYKQTVHCGPGSEAYEHCGVSLDMTEGFLVIGAPNRGGNGRTATYRLIDGTWTFTSESLAHTTGVDLGWSVVAGTFFTAASQRSRGGSAAVYEAQCPAASGAAPGTCMPCGVGTYRPAGTGPRCPRTDPGYMVNADDRSTQVACYDGEYQPLAGMEACLVSEPGYYVPNDSSPHITPEFCDGGHYSIDHGAPGCLTTEAGMYTPEGAPNDRQLPCNNGTYQDQPGKPACLTSTPGYHVPADGLAHTDQIICDAGTYQAKAGQSACTRAEVDHYVPIDGQPHTVATPCPDSTVAPLGSTGCDPIYLCRPGLTAEVPGVTSGTFGFLEPYSNGDVCGMVGRPDLAAGKHTTVWVTALDTEPGRDNLTVTCLVGSQVATSHVFSGTLNAPEAVHCPGTAFTAAFSADLSTRGDVFTLEWTDTACSVGLDGPTVLDAGFPGTWAIDLGTAVSSGAGLTFIVINDKSGAVMANQTIAVQRSTVTFQTFNWPLGGYTLVVVDAAPLAVTDVAGRTRFTLRPPTQCAIWTGAGALPSTPLDAFTADLGVKIVDTDVSVTLDVKGYLHVVQNASVLITFVDPSLLGLGGPTPTPTPPVSSRPASSAPALLPAPPTVSTMVAGEGSGAFPSWDDWGVYTRTWDGQAMCDFTLSAVHTLNNPPLWNGAPQWSVVTNKTDTTERRAIKGNVYLTYYAAGKTVTSVRSFRADVTTTRDRQEAFLVLASEVRVQHFVPTAHGCRHVIQVVVRSDAAHATFGLLGATVISPKGYTVTSVTTPADGQQLLTLSGPFDVTSVPSGPLLFNGIAAECGDYCWSYTPETDVLTFDDWLSAAECSSTVLTTESFVAGMYISRTADVTEGMKRASAATLQAAGDARLWAVVVTEADPMRYTMVLDDVTLHGSKVTSIVKDGAAAIAGVTVRPVAVIKGRLAVVIELAGGALMRSGVSPGLYEWRISVRHVARVAGDAGGLSVDAQRIVMIEPGLKLVGEGDGAAAWLSVLVLAIAVLVAM